MIIDQSLPYLGKWTHLSGTIRMRSDEVIIDYLYSSVAEADRGSWVQEAGYWVATKNIYSGERKMAYKGHLRVFPSITFRVEIFAKRWLISKSKWVIVKPKRVLTIDTCKLMY